LKAAFEAAALAAKSALREGGKAFQALLASLKHLPITAESCLCWKIFKQEYHLTVKATFCAKY
jgi:hypothetical protein